MINTDDRIFDEGLTANEGWLLQFIASKINEDRVCWPSNNTICEALKWSMKRLQATKKRLVDKGLLEVEERFRDNSPAQTSNYYKILTPLINNYTPTPKGSRGGTSKVGRAPTSKVGNQEVLISEVLTIETNTPPSGNVMSGGEDLYQKEKINTGSGARALDTAQGDLMSRMAKFRQDVLAIGETVYTEQMLEKFIAYYSQLTNGKKPKMKWEIHVKTGWEIATQLQAWAERNLNGIRCYLTTDQKTIAEKRQAFARSLEPFMERYGREPVLEFYRYWSLPENVPDPRSLRWEKEPYWDLATCLAGWFDRKSKPKPWATRNNFASNGTRDHQTRNRDLRFELNPTR